MKTKFLSLGGLWALLICTFTAAVSAQVPRQEFKAGAYRGTIQIITAIPDVAPTSTTLRVNGRSAGDPGLSMIAPPQLSQPLLSSGDDHPVKLFSLTYLSQPDRMGFSEVPNVDSAGGSTVAPLQSLQISGNVVRAEASRQLLVNSTPVTITIRVRLVRVGK